MLILLTISWSSFDHAASLEPRDDTTALMIDFSREYNDSVLVNHYVSFEETTDVNRLKERDERPSKNASFSLTIDSTVMEKNEHIPFGVNGREGRYYYRRPSTSHLQVRSSQRVHSSTTESISNADKSLSQGNNDIQIEEISCRDTDDDVFFKYDTGITALMISPSLSLSLVTVIRRLYCSILFYLFFVVVVQSIRKNDHG